MAEAGGDQLAGERCGGESVGVCMCICSFDFHLCLVSYRLFLIPDDRIISYTVFLFLKNGTKLKGIRIS